ncbi:hypothetical protein F7731_02875 [Cytobacillus depressus]|uniref:Uncharacterized protein n=1 Tax=Cytobacillus depressus TaxID=1602942 RepID=A0A6L3VA08_9BACI|nr:hypothetical protein [Cytobacillus depressus]KAB2338521.1 hypothetical protein F7731_02875 [Cytobacillus depressus]
MTANTWFQSGETDEVTNVIKEGIEVIPGVWINGSTYWLTNGLESFIANEGISVQLKQEQGPTSVQLYNVSITNHQERPLHVKLLIQNRHYQSRKRQHRLFKEYDHFSFISPSEKVAFHFDHQNVYLANGYNHERIDGASTIQPLKNVSADNIWSCPKTGKLKYNPMANGHSVSLFLYDYNFKEKGTLEGKSWVISGSNEAELIKLNESLLKTY